MTRNQAIRIISAGLRFVKDEDDVAAKDRPGFKEFKAALGELRGNEERTAKPCHGCGKALQRAARATDQVCAECRNKLTKYDALVNARERTGEKEYEFPSRDYGWPYFHWIGHLYGSERDACDPNRGFRLVLWKVASLLGRPAIAGWTRPDGSNAEKSVKKLPDAYHAAKIGGSDKSFYDHENIRLLTKEEAQAIDELDLAARRMLRAVYAQGVDDGQSLLRQIASGEMTIADFNKEALRLQGKGRRD